MLNDRESNVCSISTDAKHKIVCNGVGLKNYHHKGSRVTMLPLCASLLAHPIKYRHPECQLLAGKRSSFNRKEALMKTCNSTLLRSTQQKENTFF